MEIENNNQLYKRLINNSYGDDAFLFHYTSLNSACKILESKSLKLSNLSNTNDPLEFILGGGFSYNGWGEMEQMFKIMRELTISSRKRQNYIRMMCFCLDNFCSIEDWQNEKNKPLPTIY